MSTQLNKFKYIINSGCSYGEMAESIKKPIETGLNDSNQEKDKWFITDDDVVIIDVALPSQGVEYISDSTIHTVNYLTKLGVLPKNIYCFIEWSQWSRITIPPYKFIDYKKHLNFSDKKNFNIGILGQGKSNDYLVKALKGLDITSSEEIHNIGKIGDRVYITPTHTGFDEIGNPPELVSYLERAQEVERSISEEVKVKNYIDTILRTQYFLKSKNISYNCCFMQGSLCGWFDKEDFMYSHYPETSNQNDWSLYDKKTNEMFLIQDRIPMDENYDVENVIPSIRKTFNLIDWSKFWTYDKNNFRRGGYDEWCFDNFGLCSMIQPNIVYDISHLNNEYSVQETRTNFGDHPNVNLYKLLWNDIAKDCNFLKMDEKWCKEIERRFREDKKSNESFPTIHGVTLSESYLYKRTKHTNISIGYGTRGIL